MNQTVSMDFVADTEDVARILFSPLFISEGILSQKAFTLELQTNETYISVLRPAVPSFKDDMEGIKKDGNALYGYALLNVGAIRQIHIDYPEEIKLDVLPRNASKRKSHAGIFATIGEENYQYIHSVSGLEPGLFHVYYEIIRADTSSEATIAYYKQLSREYNRVLQSVPQPNK